jgi:hypothetical protein
MSPFEKHELQRIRASCGCIGRTKLTSAVAAGPDAFDPPGFAATLERCVPFDDICAAGLSVNHGFPTR